MFVHFFGFIPLLCLIPFKFSKLVDAAVQRLH